MIKLSKLADYGTLILAEMANAPQNMQSAADLAEKTRIPQTTVRKLLKLLAAHEIVVSKLGKQGGYRLKESPENIPLLNIIEALDGPLGMTECSNHLHQCEIEGSCQIKPHWQKINRVIFNALKNLSLADLR